MFNYTVFNERKPPPRHLISTEEIWDSNQDFWISLYSEVMDVCQITITML